MRILIGHNRYQNPGGEDAVVASEAKLLRDHGHEVLLYDRTNDEIDSLSGFQKVSYAVEMKWSRKTYKEIKKIIKDFRPHIAHFHNIFFMITPSSYSACREAGIPVVQSQHNFRLSCSNALFYRDNHPCEDCTKKTLWEGVKHRCYKKSFIMTALAVKMIDHHWKKKTWSEQVDAYIVASEFGRKKLIQAGISSGKVFVKPNFVGQEISPNQREDRGYALYVGRLSQEKGVDVMLKAWKNIRIPLKIIGDGPMAGELKNTANDLKLKNVEFLGYSDKTQYVESMKGAKLLVVPSVCYENFPRIIAEGFSFGIPIAASRIGTLMEIIKERETGTLFDPGDPDDCALKINELLKSDERLKVMGQNAFKEYSEKYSAEKNYALLNGVYQSLLN